MKITAALLIVLTISLMFTSTMRQTVVTRCGYVAKPIDTLIDTFLISERTSSKYNGRMMT